MANVYQSRLRLRRSALAARHGAATNQLSRCSLNGPQHENDTAVVVESAVAVVLFSIAPIEIIAPGCACLQHLSTITAVILFSVAPIGVIAPECALKKL